MPAAHSTNNGDPLMTRESDSRVLLVTLAMATGTGGGHVAFNFCRALQRNAWQVVLACGPAPPEEGGEGTNPEMRAAGVEIRQLDRTVAPTWPVWRRLRAIAGEVRPAAVIGVMQRDRTVAMALSRALGVPGIVTAANQHVFWGSPPVRVAKRALYRFALRKWASLVVCASEPVRQEIRAFGVPDERAVLLPNGIVVRERLYLAPEDREAARAELGAGPSDLLLLNVGRLDVQKGQDILVEAFALCARTRPRLRLAFIGDVSGGANRARMAAFAEDVRRRAASSGVANQMVFAGWRTDVARLLSAADGYVHAARWEGLSLAILEAMAAALPVVMTDCSGTPEGFVEAEHGWIVPKGDARALAEAIGRLADLTPERRAGIGRAARALIEERYDIRKIGARFAELVEAAVARGR
jgi:glycosyltransferase involved in cell wall biosynthesis